MWVYSLFVNVCIIFQVYVCPFEKTCTFSCGNPYDTNVHLKRYFKVFFCFYCISAFVHVNEFTCHLKSCVPPFSDEQQKIIAKQSKA